MSAPPGPLVARTRAVPGPLDLVDLAGADGQLHVQGGVGLAGRGVVARGELAQVTAVLASVELDDEVGRPGTGAVAFGALPFLDDRPGELVVPEVVWGAGPDGRSWVTTIGPADAPPPDVAALCWAATSGPPTAIGPVRVEPVRDPAWWCALVARATEAMRASDGRLSKVVLARELVAEAEAAFDRTGILRRLQAAYPDCFVFLVDGFLGASPELLVGRSGERVHAQPMAGTAPRGGDPSSDAALAADLLSSTTYRREHQITIDMVYDTLLPWCSYLDYEAEPSIVRMANVQHLATLVEGRLSQPEPSILELVQALHPTPAVCGWPRAAAQAWIQEHEGFDRGHYAGTVGWVDARGNGTWAVAIRCAEVHGSTARLYAGNGIIADSDPDTELAETEAKLSAMLSALAP
ncbi:MAG: isochorismate synthase [Acidimicrobiales bacterium]|nr:isochorismate synthase [Acidimicrobiales bacterium]